MVANVGMAQMTVPRQREGGLVARLETGIVLAVEAAAAVLVAVEVVVLLAGVIFRYALRSPLVWSDELASLLFLWLAVLGSALAFQRSEHMRMTTLVGLLGPRARRGFDLVALTVSTAFFALAVKPAITYVLNAIPIVTDTLQISTAWRAAAMPVGFALVALLGVIRLVRLARSGQHDALSLAAAVLVPLVAIAAGAALEPVLRHLGNYNLVIFFAFGVTACVLAGLPIAIAFAFCTYGYLALTTRIPMPVVVGRIDEGMSQLILLAVPLFVFLGMLMSMTGMARAMVAFLASLVGHMRGGLSYVLIGAMYLVSGISGAKAADMAAVAPVLFPEMRERGAKPGDLVALLAATGAQTETIPPSLVLITLGSVTGVSTAALFTGGLLPGFVLALVLCAVVWSRHRRLEASTAIRPPWREVGRGFMLALPALLLPIVIRACVVEGVATATEVSTIGIAYCVVVGLLVYRRFDWRLVAPMLVNTAALSGAILLIIGAATSMAWALTQSGFSRQLAAWMEALPGGQLTFMAVSIGVFAVLGSVLEGIPAIVLFGPLLFPIAKAMGIHEVHYAIVVILAMGLGLFAPPIGIGYYTACAIGKVDPSLGMRAIAPYLLALLLGILVIAFVPWITLGFL